MGGIYYATMAFTTFESELLRTPTNKPDYQQREPRSARIGGPDISEVLNFLSYNQGLVEFADSKAGSLILLNSLLIAAVAALPNDGELGVFKLASVVLSSAAVYVCFQVIKSSDKSDNDPKYGKRRPESAGWEQNDFLFFGSIGKFKSGDDYCRAVVESTEDDRLRALLHRTYVVAKIARRKFAQYRTAQHMTSVALISWVVVNVLPFLRG